MDAARTAYVAPVPRRVASISVAATATRAASGAVVRIFTKGHNNKVGLGDVLSYSTRNVSLSELSAIGGDRVELVVTAGDGVSKRTYTIDVERVGPGTYGEGFAPRTASGFPYDDALTVRAGTDPTVRDLTVIPKLDLVAPSFVASFPRVSSVTSATIEMAVQLSEPGVVYYLVVPDGTRAPTSREVKEAKELRTADLMVSSAVVAGNITSLKSLTAETTALVDSGVRRERRTTCGSLPKTTRGLRAGPGRICRRRRPSWTSPPRADNRREGESLLLVFIRVVCVGSTAVIM